MATTYPIPVFHFSVEGAGARIGFTEVSGLKFSVDPIEYRDGNSPEYHVTKYSGMHKFSNITLKRGIFVGNNDLFIWLTNVNLSKPDRRTITIKLLDETHAPVVTYTCNNCFPIGFDGVSFKSTGNETAVESIEIVCESWTVANG